MSDPSRASRQTAGRMMTRRAMLTDAARIGGAAVVTGILGTVVIRAIGGKGFLANANGPDTITLPFTYSTEKSAWLQAAIDAFQRGGATYNGKRILIVPDARGSLDALTRILSGELRPVVWSPASALELNQLQAGWDQAHAGAPILPSQKDLTPRSLVSSPLVLVVWQERAKLLTQKFGDLAWKSLHNALTLGKGWAEIPGGSESWGLVKFGQTRPDRSNSGVLTLALLAQAVAGPDHPLTVAAARDTAYVEFMRGVEDAVTQFGSSSGSFLDCALNRGPAGFDVISTYEHLALAALSANTGRALTLSYPNPTMLSDHPYAILQGASEEQTGAAKQLRDFLLSAEQQKRALAYGFRPVDANIHLTDGGIAGNLFAKSIPGAQVSLQSGVAPAPGGDVVNALIDGWTQFYQDRPITPGC
jgi:Bacterial extracellular solute-binding protein